MLPAPPDGNRSFEASDEYSRSGRKNDIVHSAGAERMFEHLKLDLLYLTGQ
ncbi:MAG: hypothetical protein KAR17_12360 [Cyclobacteriaceae bacterium]|nr:hypothetical protein [Cyclobacteriaceae bacterium]